MTSIKKKKAFLKVFALLNEAQKRRFAALRVIEIGWGGLTEVAHLTGLSFKTIRKGKRELESSDTFQETKRVRKTGGGRKKIEVIDPAVVEDLEKIMDENTAGDPMSLLKWTNKSTYIIAKELRKKDHKIGPDSVGRLLKKMNYSLQINKKSLEGSSKPERDAQFNFINKQVKNFIDKGAPVISVDAKKKESVGNFKNNGKTWGKKGCPKEVNVYDFPSLANGRAIPYGVYDLMENSGFVNVGISYDTSEFAVESIRQWWNIKGKYNYESCKGILITADDGGSNGSRRKGWKFFLQEFSDEIGIPISVCHFPPGTSKWNKIEHRLFSFISINWRGEPLVSYQIIINLINSTVTKTGLTVVAQLDKREYVRGRKFSDKEMRNIKLKPNSLHSKWNYTIFPRV